MQYKSVCEIEAWLRGEIQATAREVEAKIKGEASNVSGYDPIGSLTSDGLLQSNLSETSLAPAITGREARPGRLGSAYTSHVYHPDVTTLDLRHEELGITCRYLVALSMDNGKSGKTGQEFNLAPPFVCKDLSLKLDQTPFVFKAKTARGARGTLQIKKHDETKWNRRIILVYMHDVNDA